MILPRLTLDRVALLAAIAGPLAVGAALTPVRHSLSNTDTALLLVAVVVAVATVGHRVAGYLAAVSSAAWFDSLSRMSTSPSLAGPTSKPLCCLVIGVAVTELAVWGRRQAVAASRRAGYVD